MQWEGMRIHIVWLAASYADYGNGYSCQSTLLALTEDWRQSLDGGHFVGAILMDLSKAFDCLPGLPHRLLLEKLRAYNLAESAVSLLGSYPSDREQCVKIGNDHSASLPMYKGVPQGSIIGPVLFNIFINDIFHFTDHTKLYNYADGNTISYSSPHFDTMKQTLEVGGLALWLTGSQLTRWKQTLIVQRHSKKYETNCSNCSKSTKIGTHVD